MKLGLGTAQFGSQYGISNRVGPPAVEEVEKILEVAGRCGVDVIDTAASYGSSESVIGHCLRPGHGFRIVTKLAPLGADGCTREGVRRTRARFELSLENLRQARVYGLLAHRVEDVLASDGARLVDAMRELAASGRVQKIGVSVYSPEEIERVLEVFTPDIVEAPINAFDQRVLASGHLAKLAARGVEIHARSLFLQGLLLMEPGQTPPYFSPWREHLERYVRFVGASGYSRLQAALAFARRLPHVEVALVGVNRAVELEEIAAAFNGAPAEMAGFDEFAVADESLVNPSRWQTEAPRPR